MGPAYNTAQYALLLFANLILIVCTLLFHYSFHGSLVETFFLASVIITSLFCLITSVIFWINPNIFNRKSVEELIIFLTELNNIGMQF